MAAPPAVDVFWFPALPAQWYRTLRWRLTCATSAQPISACWCTERGGSQIPAAGCVEARLTRPAAAAPVPGGARPRLLGLPPLRAPPRRIRSGPHRAAAAHALDSHQGPHVLHRGPASAQGALPARPSARSHSASLQRTRRLNSILARAAQADCQGICCRFTRITLTAISEPARGPALKSRIWTKRRYLPQLLGSPGSVKPGCLQRTASLGLAYVGVDPGGPGGGRQKHQPQRLW